MRQHPLTIRAIAAALCLVLCFAVVLFAPLALGTPAWGQDAASVPAGSLYSPSIRAQIIPLRQTILSSEIAGAITDLPVREGEAFARGDVLVAFDCDTHRARLARAEASEQAASRKVDVAGRLDELSSISLLEVDEAKANLAIARAESELGRVFVRRCAIAAPFPGRVARSFVQRYQYVSEGQQLLDIVDDSALELEMIVPSRWLSWLRAGHAFSVRVDERDVTLRATITRIGARVDPVSQSIKVFASFVESAEGLVAGMSGIATIAPGAAGG